MTPSARGHIEDGGGLTATGDPSDNLTLRSIALTSATENDRHDCWPRITCPRCRTCVLRVAAGCLDDGVIKGVNGHRGCEVHVDCLADDRRAIDARHDHGEPGGQA
ncbi:MAG: hypothetical protein JWP76_2287 [Dactylosporangium sp.]|nr:hypothetical protein [Dactylosporangium sp.]